jgi:hypothetical protein
MERGYTPASIVLDAPVVFRDRVGHVWRPQNDNGKFSGRCACARRWCSRETLVSVRLLDAIGVDFARKYITQFGFKLESLPPNLSMSLGTASLTPDVGGARLLGVRQRRLPDRPVFHRKSHRPQRRGDRLHARAARLPPVPAAADNGAARGRS